MSASPESEPLVEPVEAKAPARRRVLWRTLALLIFAGVAIAFVQLTMLARVQELEPLTRVASLPHADKLDPHHIDSRLILVGDVHGMYKELKQLLHKVDFDSDQDTLVFLGDMITKGPDSLKVVDLAIDAGAYCVRGNHEDEIMSMYADWHHLVEPRTFPPSASASTVIAGSKPTATLDATTSAPTATSDVSVRKGNFERDLKLVKQLKKRHIRYLERCPAILQLGQVSKRGIEAVAVHGGLMWNVDTLEDQDVSATLRVRAIKPPDYTEPSEDPEDGEPWFGRWNDAQRARPKSERYEVFYGHDASKGLQLRRYSKGLDTRCQREGKLSAYVVSVKHSGRYHEDLVQINC